MVDVDSVRRRRCSFLHEGVRTYLMEENMWNGLGLSLRQGIL